MIQIWKGIDYLHNFKNILHRDLKPLNILLKSKKTITDSIKIADFGLSTNNPEYGFYQKLDGKMGTLLYMAPELLDNNKGHDKSVDIWASGVIMYNVLFANKNPFYTKTDDKNLIADNITNREIDYDSLGCSDQAKDLLKRLLEKDPAKRYTVGETLNHPWCTGKSLEDRILTSDELMAMFYTRTNFKKFFKALVFIQFLRTYDKRQFPQTLIRKTSRSFQKTPPKTAKNFGVSVRNNQHSKSTILIPYKNSKVDSKTDVYNRLYCSPNPSTDKKPRPKSSDKNKNSITNNNIMIENKIDKFQAEAKNEKIEKKYTFHSIADSNGNQSTKRISIKINLEQNSVENYSTHERQFQQSKGIEKYNYNQRVIMKKLSKSTREIELQTGQFFEQGGSINQNNSVDDNNNTPCSMKNSYQNDNKTRLYKKQRKSLISEFDGTKTNPSSFQRESYSNQDIGNDENSGCKKSSTSNSNSNSRKSKKSSHFKPVYSFQGDEKPQSNHYIKPPIIKYGNPFNDTKSQNNMHLVDNFSRSSQKSSKKSIKNQSKHDLAHVLAVPGGMMDSEIKSSDKSNISEYQKQCSNIALNDSKSHNSEISHTYSSKNQLKKSINLKGMHENPHKVDNEHTQPHIETPKPIQKLPSSDFHIPTNNHIPDIKQHTYYDNQNYCNKVIINTTSNKSLSNLNSSNSIKDYRKNQDGKNNDRRRSLKDVRYPIKAVKPKEKPKSNWGNVAYPYINNEVEVLGNNDKSNNSLSFGRLNKTANANSSLSFGRSANGNPPRVGPSTSTIALAKKNSKFF